MPYADILFLITTPYLHGTLKNMRKIWSYFCICMCLWMIICIPSFFFFLPKQYWGGDALRIVECRECNNYRYKHWTWISFVNRIYHVAIAQNIPLKNIYQWHCIWNYYTFTIYKTSNCSCNISLFRVIHGRKAEPADCPPDKKKRICKHPPLNDFFVSLCRLETAILAASTA